MRAVVLLRGMNTGGVRFPMKDLAAALTAEGHTDVRTVLASGNVVLTGAFPHPSDAARAVVVVIEREFGHRLDAVGADGDTVRSAVEGYPFARAADRHAYVVFATDTALLRAAAEGARDLDPAVEQVRLGDGVLYWDVLKGETLRTRFGKGAHSRRTGGAVTVRNLNTLEKILATVG